MSLQTAVLAALALLAIAAAVFKGSRAPQFAVASGPPSPKSRSAWLAVAPVICAALSFAALRLFGWFLDKSNGFHVPSWPVRLLFAIGIIAPWFVGAYSAFLVARGRNVALRTIGVLEVVICLLYGCAYAFAMTVGLA